MSTPILLRDVPRQRSTVVVLGARIALTVYWHPLSSSWLADISINNRPRVRGRRIALNADLTRYITDPLLTGKIVCRSLTDSENEPGLHAWGITHEMRHETA